MQLNNGCAQSTSTFLASMRLPWCSPVVASELQRATPSRLRPMVMPSESGRPLRNSLWGNLATGVRIPRMRGAAEDLNLFACAGVAAAAAAREAIPVLRVALRLWLHAPQ